MNLHLRLQHGVLFLSVLSAFVTGITIRYGSSPSAIPFGLWYQLHAWSGWTSLFLSVIFCTSAHLLLRDGAANGHGIELFLRWKVIVGLFIYACGTGLWLICLSSLDLSVAFPASAIQFIVVMLGARVLLGEPLPVLRVIGGAVITLGILLLLFEGKGRETE